MDRVTGTVPSASGPIVFVVENDVAGRQELEALIRSAGWQPKTFAAG